MASEIKLENLFSSTKGTMIVYEKVTERKKISFYSLDEDELINGIVVFSIKEADSIIDKITAKGYKLILSDDYLKEERPNQEIS